MLPMRQHLVCMAKCAIKNPTGKSPYGVTGIVTIPQCAVFGWSTVGMKNGVNGKAASVGIIMVAGK